MHDMDNAQLLRIREKLADYSFTISWTQGKQNKIAGSPMLGTNLPGHGRRAKNEHINTMPRSYNNDGDTAPT